MKWIECDGCTTEFRVVSDSDEAVSYCPYCGDSIDEVEEDPEEED